jgi:putative oxidoreductase
MTLDQQVTLRSWAVVPLRVVVGIGFVVHGYAKLSRGPAGFAKLLDQIGVPLPLPTAWAVTSIELLGGLALIAGIGVLLVSLPLIASMLAAMIQVQARYGFSSVQTIGLTADGPVFGPPGYEINLLYIAALVLIAIVGPGPMSVKSWMATRNA